MSRSRILPWWAPVPRWNLGRRRLHAAGSPLHHGLSRRTVLRGMLQGSVVTVGLPPLLAFSRDARASTCANGFPKRFGLFFWGNGNRPEYWNPEGEGTDWELSEELASLAPVKDKISVVSGMSVIADNISPHWSGAVGLLTGRPLVGLDSDWDVAEPTIDQRIAAELGGATIYRSLEVGVGTERSMSWAGPSANYPADEDPYHFYERVFGASFREPGEDGEPDPSLGYRRSVLDAVMDDIRSLQNRVGTEDKDRLERHFEGIRDLELRLARLEEDPPSLESCSRPDTPDESYPDIDGRPQLSAKSRALADLIAMSLACDQTRVFGFTFGYPVKNTLFPGASDGHHTLTHNEAVPQPEVHAITTSIIEEYSYLLQVLDSIPEGEGTLLDNCCVVGTSDVSEGRTHSLDDMPLVIAGGACGALKTGVHYRSYSQENINKASLSILRAMGMTIEGLGVDESYVTDGLSAIEEG